MISSRVVHLYNRKHGASFGQFADKVYEQQTAQLEEVKQISLKHIQAYTTHSERSQQALVQKYPKGK
jgi:hypothetical protein